MVCIDSWQLYQVSWWGYDCQDLLVRVYSLWKGILTTICYEFQLSEYKHAWTVMDWLRMPLQMSSFIQAWLQLICIMRNNSIRKMIILVVLGKALATIIITAGEHHWSWCSYVNHMASTNTAHQQLRKIVPPPGMWLCEGRFIDQQFSSQHWSCADVPCLRVSLDESQCFHVLRNA